MTVTTNLRDDHDLILTTLTCFTTALTRARSEPAVKPQELAPFIEFVRGFADQCHHAKEELLLFPALVRAGLPAHGGPVGCMLEEHLAGRTCLATMHDAIASADDDPQGAMVTLQRQGAAYVELLRSHIAKENGVLFEMADRLLRGDDAARVLDDLRTLAADTGHAAEDQRGRRLAAQMLDRYA